MDETAWENYECEVCKRTVSVRQTVNFGKELPRGYLSPEQVKEKMKQLKYFLRGQRGGHSANCSCARCDDLDEALGEVFGKED